MIRNTFFAGLVCSGLCLLPGCTALSPGRWFAEKPPQVTALNPVTNIVCLWEPSEGRDQSGMPTRGFKGQILFFTRASEVPVIANGQVEIAQFDEQGNPEQWGKPLKQFDFSPSQWNTFLQNGMLGSTYSLFVPYARKEHFQTNVSLRLKWTPAEGGQSIYSTLTQVTLPGPLRPEVEGAQVQNQVRRREGGIDGLRKIVADSLTPIPSMARTASDPRVQTIHRWEQPGYPTTFSVAATAPQNPIQLVGGEEETPEQPRRRFTLSSVNPE